MIISEIRYDQYEEAKRLDAEYYLPEYIEVENLLKNLRLVSQSRNVNQETLYF